MAAPKLLYGDHGPVTGSTWDGFFLYGICRNCGRPIRFNPQDESPIRWRHMTDDNDKIRCAGREGSK